MTLRAVPVFVAFVMVILTNVLWYRAKFVLQSRGYPMSFIRHHNQDLRHLSQLVRAETDPGKRRRYVRLRNALFISIGITLCTFAALIASAVYAGRTSPTDPAAVTEQR